MAETKKLIYRNDNDEVVVDNSLEGNKVVLYEDEFVKIATTGHFYDFIATVENKDSEAITIVFEGESEFVVDFVVDGKDWVGILADEEGWDALVAICAGDFHIEGGDDFDKIDENEILATLKSTNISSVDLDREFCNRVISLIENKNAQVVELEKKLKTAKAEALKAFLDKLIDVSVCKDNGDGTESLYVCISKAREVLRTMVGEDND